MGKSAHFFLLVFLLEIIVVVEKPIEDGEIFQVFRNLHAFARRIFWRKCLLEINIYDEFKRAQ